MVLVRELEGEDMSNKTTTKTGFEITNNHIYVILIIIMILPLFFPLKTPFTVTESTLSVYNTIEALPSGSIVIISGSNNYGFHVEVKECLEACLKHLYQQDVKIVFVSFAADTQMFFKIVRNTIGISENIPYMGKIYGEDWVDLGYITGGEGALAQFCNNPQIVTMDAYGTPTKDLAIMNKIGPADTWSLYIDASGNFIASAVRQVVVPYKTTMVALNTAGWYPSHVPYVNAGLIKGMTMGIRGAAEYETLVGYVGVGHSGADMLNMVHGFIIFLVIIRNISWLMSKREKEET